MMLIHCNDMLLGPARYTMFFRTSVNTLVDTRMTPQSQRVINSIAEILQQKRVRCPWVQVQS
jgi:hypothetical protein